MALLFRRTEDEIRAKQKKITERLPKIKAFRVDAMQHIAQMEPLGWLAEEIVEIQNDIIEIRNFLLLTEKPAQQQKPKQ